MFFSQGLLLLLWCVASQRASAITKDVEVSVRDVVPMDGAAAVDFVYPTKALHHSGVLAMLAAAVSKAEVLGRPECVVLVDVSGAVLGQVRMTGANFLTAKTALAKAKTAAAYGRPTSPTDLALAAATGGDLTGLPGGLPIKVDGVLLGAIGVGSLDDDLRIPNAALAAVGALTFDESP